MAQSGGVIKNALKLKNIYYKIMKKLLFIMFLFGTILTFGQDCYYFNKTVNMNTNESERSLVEFCIYQEEETVVLAKVPFLITDADTSKKDRVYLLGVSSRGAKVLFVIFKGKSYIDVYSEDLGVNIRLYKEKQLY